MGLTIRELATRLGAELAGSTEGVDCEVSAVQPVATAGPADVTFVADPKHEAAAATSLAAAVMVAKPIEGLTKLQLVVENINVALIEALNCFAPTLKPPVEGVDASARMV